MTVRSIRGQDDRPTVVLAGDRAIVDGLTIDDSTALMLLERTPEPDRAVELRRMIGVGAQGLASMGIGLDLAAVDSRLASVVDGAAAEARETLTAIIEQGTRSLGEQFDPEQRSSILARALADFGEWRDGLLRRLDPAVDGSATKALVHQLEKLVGPGGDLEKRLHEALDLEGSDSALAAIKRAMEEGFTAVRADIVNQQAAEAARRQEAERGTAHGLDFEEAVEARLRSWATGRGAVVERTSTTAGSLSSDSKVGDFVVELGDGHRIVIEAKRQAAIGLSGSGGILAELDAAMANRRADLAVCVAGRDAYPAEVGRFGVYGDRILVVDEGEGTMIEIAMQWAAAATVLRARGLQPDASLVSDRIDRIRKAADQLSGARRSITALRGSLDKLHETLGELRGDILDHAGDLDRILGTPDTESLGAGGTCS